MFYSQRLNLLLAISLLVLSLVSAQKSNAQTVEVTSLDPKSEASNSSSSQGENQVDDAVEKFLEMNQSYGISSKVKENYYLADYINNESTQEPSLPNKAKALPETKNTEGVLLAATWEESESNTGNFVFDAPYPTPLKLSQIINGTNIPSSSLLPQTLIAEESPSDSSTPNFDSPRFLVSVPESSNSVLPLLGLAALGLLPTRFRKNHRC